MNEFLRRRAILTLSFVPVMAISGAAADAEDVALLCGKAILCAADQDARQVIDDAVVLVSDGKIVEVGRASEVDVPDGYRVVDHGDGWITPGMIDLHSHIGQEGLLADWNASVWPVNPGLRVSTSVEPANQYMKRAVAGGVTAVLYIPGSGMNMSGAGVLLKTAPDTYERALIRDPGSLKLAQAGNPERWAIGVGRSFMNYNIRSILRRGTEYAKKWEAFERGEGSEPIFDQQFEIFRGLRKKALQFSVHTQMYQVVLMTLTMVRMEFGYDLYIDHGTFDGWRAAALAEKLGVAAILGPRSVSTHMVYPGFVENDTDGKLNGVAAKYQEEGHTAIGFNTDAVNPNFSNGPWTEELPLQAAMGIRYGFDNSGMQALRGLTIVPAQAAGIDDRVGSIEKGKDADLVISDGDPTDPRNRVREVYVEGELAYARDDDPTVW